MNIFCINLNIHYSLSESAWCKVAKVYEEMPCWFGYIDDIPTWYNKDDKLIEISIEPSGMQVYAVLPEEEWESWIALFKEKLTHQLGYPIGEVEEEHDFV